MTERRRMRRTEKENGELGSLETVGSWKSCELFRDILNVMVYFTFFIFCSFWTTPTVLRYFQLCAQKPILAGSVPHGIHARQLPLPTILSL